MFQLNSQDVDPQIWRPLNGRLGVLEALWLHRSKSVSAGLNCGLDCMPVVSMTLSAVAVAVCGFGARISAMALRLSL